MGHRFDDDEFAPAVPASDAAVIRKIRARRLVEQERLTRFICQACKTATHEHRTHPGAQHLPGICDCPCR